MTDQLNYLSINYLMNTLLTTVIFCPIDPYTEILNSGISASEDLSISIILLQHFIRIGFPLEDFFVLPFEAEP